MMVTPDDAKIMACPHRLGVLLPMGQGANGCLAGSCMVWRWEAGDAPTKGRCGLAPLAPAVDDVMVKLPGSPALTYAIHHLLWIWVQYGGGTIDGDRVFLPHQFDQTGERAADWLEAIGLGEAESVGFVLNDAGLTFLDLYERDVRRGVSR